MPPREVAAPAPIDLNETLTFSNAANCEASKGTDALLNRVLTPPNGDVANITAGAIEIGPDGTRVQSLLTKTPGENGSDMIFEGVADFLQPATWQGLRVRGVAASLYVVPEADSTYTRQIRFLEDGDTVRAALNRHGFNIPASPAYAELQDDACGGSMQIVDVAGGSALQCSWGC